MICRAHLVKVRDRYDQLTAMGGRALFIVHDEPARIRTQLLAGIDPPFPILVDEARTAYRAWGMGRARWAQIWLDPAVWRAYARLLRSGERLRKGGKDALQLGGDFVVDPNGTIVYSRPQQRDDRPPVGELLKVVRQIAGP
ncbi:MAG: AhpC/TSA family protein [Nitriliruptoraceae bacterium]